MLPRGRSHFQGGPIEPALPKEPYYRIPDPQPQNQWLSDALNFDRPASRTDVEKLADTLRPPEISPVQRLCDDAVKLLEQAGARTTVNGVDAYVTRQACKVPSNLGSYFARLGQRVDTHGEFTELPSVIFTTTRNFNAAIQTADGRFSHLFFNGHSGMVNLLNGPDEEDAMGYHSDLPGHIELVRKIVDKIGWQFTADQRTARILERHAPASHAVQAGVFLPPPKLHIPPTPHTTPARAATHGPVPLTDSFVTALRRRDEEKSAFTISRSAKQAAATAMALLGIAYSDNFGGTADFVNEGVYFLSLAQVDIRHQDNSVQEISPGQFYTAPSREYCNADRVCSRDFGSILGGLLLRPGLVVNKIPVGKFDLPGYASAGVETTHPNHKIHANPGLFEYPLAAKYAPESKKPQAANCFAIEGDYTAGKSQVISGSAQASKTVRLQVTDAGTMEVCKTAATPKHPHGSIFVYQK